MDELEYLVDLEHDAMHKIQLVGTQALTRISQFLVVAEKPCFVNAVFKVLSLNIEIY